MEAGQLEYDTAGIEEYLTQVVDDFKKQAQASESLQ